METYILDTNFIYAMIDSEDAMHESTIKVLSEIPKESTFVIPFIVLAELIVVDVGIDIINLMLQNEVIIYQSGVSDLRVIDEVLSSKQKRTLRANDCLVIGAVVKTKGTLLSFDKKLLKIVQNVL